MELNFGISMRVTNASNYFEPRDSIARDWSNYMLTSFPESKWLFIPNIEDEVEKYIKKWNINVLILSGGDDIGMYTERDKTELQLIKIALRNNIPIIAICRGLQLIHTFFGGKLLAGDSTFILNHRAKKHKIILNDKEIEVNSYHTNMLDEKTIDKQFKIIGRCKKDNSIECIKSNGILAMMWHPERENVFHEWNINLIKKFLRNE